MNFTNSKELRVAVQEDWSRGAIDLIVYETDGQTMNVMTDYSMSPNSDYATIVPEHKSLHLSHESAQELMDRLWRVGIRPSERRDVNEIISAKDEHIGDLRKVLTAYIGAK